MQFNRFSVQSFMFFITVALVSESFYICIEKHSEITMFTLLKVSVNDHTDYYVISETKKLEKTPGSNNLYTVKSGPLEEVSGEVLLKHNSKTVLDALRENIKNDIPKVLLERNTQELELDNSKSMCITSENESGDFFEDTVHNLDHGDQRDHLVGSQSISNKTIFLGSETIKEKQSQASRGFKVPSSNQGTKKYFCIFCKNLTAKLPRHLELIHKEEPDVQQMLSLRKGSTRTWSTPQKAAIREHFAENFKKKSLPSITDCRNVIQTFPVLQGKKPAAIKSWINTEINRKEIAKKLKF